MNKDPKFSTILQDTHSFFFKDGWLTVCDNLDNSNEFDRGGIYCALLHKKVWDTASKTYNWDTHYGANGPSIITSYAAGRKRTYYQSQSSSGIENLVLHRSEFGHYEDFIELSEDFRLYYNLYEKKDLQKTEYIHVDNNGDDILVAVIENQKRVRIKYNVILDYINTRKIALALYFDIMNYFTESLSELAIPETNDFVTSKDLTYNLLIKDSAEFSFDNSKTHSWLMGKMMLFPATRYNIDYFNRISSDKNIFAEFIYDFDKNGLPKLFTCNEEKLANYFGKNPGSPQYVTPVYFKRDVLKKYYDTPKKYKVNDGYVACAGFWHLRIDNSCSDYVVAFLGDLGKLAYKEQLYWKSYNIEKQKGLSFTGFKRAFMGEPANPQSEDLYFKMVFQTFNETWFADEQWYFFKPLAAGDLHHFDSLHRLTSPDNAKEFDEQILSLTKLLIDSMNEKEIGSRVKLEGNDKGIDKLEKYLANLDYQLPELVKFFRNLQQLRSTTVAHRRSDSNKKAIECELFFHIGEKSLDHVLDDILTMAIKTIDSLSALNRKLRHKEVSGDQDEPKFT